MEPPAADVTVDLLLRIARLELEAERDVRDGLAAALARVLRVER